jgi:hypothetical protein
MKLCMYVCMCVFVQYISVSYINEIMCVCVYVC